MERAGVRDSQQNKPPCRDFTLRTKQAGVQDYTAFLRDKRM